MKIRIKVTSIGVAYGNTIPNKSLNMNNKQSSPEMASKAARVLVRVKTSKTEKSLAGCVLSQAMPAKIRVRVKK